MPDEVFRMFLMAQLDAGLALSTRSDILELTPQLGDPPDRYIADYRCLGLVRKDRDVGLADRFIVGIRFPADYLGTFQPERVITILAPTNIWHPNVTGPFLCPGEMQPGTPLVDLLFQIYDVLSGHRVTMDEHHALNPDACAWARAHRDAFPSDHRPLCRRPVRGWAPRAAQPIEAAQ
jgi:hypothetical protein